MQSKKQSSAQLKNLKALLKHYDLHGWRLVAFIVGLLVILLGLTGGLRLLSESQDLRGRAKTLLGVPLSPADQPAHRLFCPYGVQGAGPYLLYCELWGIYPTNPTYIEDQLAFTVTTQNPAAISKESEGWWGCPSDAGGSICGVAVSDIYDDVIYDIESIDTWNPPDFAGLQLGMDYRLGYVRIQFDNNPGWVHLDPRWDTGASGSYWKLQYEDPTAFSAQHITGWHTEGPNPTPYPWASPSPTPPPGASPTPSPTPTYGVSVEPAQETRYGSWIPFVNNDIVFPITVTNTGSTWGTFQSYIYQGTLWVGALSPTSFTNMAPGETRNAVFSVDLPDFTPPGLSDTFQVYIYNANTNDSGYYTAVTVPVSSPGPSPTPGASASPTPPPLPSPSPTPPPLPSPSPSPLPSSGAGTCQCDIHNIVENNCNTPYEAVCTGTYDCTCSAPNTQPGWCGSSCSNDDYCHTGLTCNQTTFTCGGSVCNASPSPAPNQRQACTATGGRWRTFTNSCADFCTTGVCQNVSTASCDCGSNLCWTGTSCVTNPKSQSTGLLDQVVNSVRQLFGF